MEKMSLDFDQQKIMRLAAGGLLTGGAAAALLQLLRSAREGRDTLVDSGKVPQTDENTLVLTLPPKLAEACGTSHIPISHPVKKEGLVKDVTNFKLNSTRDKNGKYIKLADGSPTGWPTLTGGVLAALGGGTLGYAIINKIMQKHKEQQLAKMLDAAQQEYLDKLVGKTACAADAFLPYSTEELEKSAQDHQGFLQAPGFLSWPIAAAALLTLLGTGGAGYITKKMLDEKVREQETANLDVPKVKKIIFRTAPLGQAPDAKLASSDTEECATEDDIDCVKAALAVKIAHLSGNPEHILTPEVMKLAAEEAKGVLGNIGSGVDSLMEALGNNKLLQKALWAAAKGKHQILSHLPGGNALGQHMAGRRVAGLGEQFKDWIGKQSSSISIPIPTVAGVLSSTMGSAIAGKQQAADLAKEIAVAQEAISNEKKKEKEQDTQDQVVDIVSNDPNAAAYVASHEAKIKQLVARMLKEKQL